MEPKSPTATSVTVPRPPLPVHLLDIMEEDDDVQNVWHNWDQD